MRELNVNENIQNNIDSISVVVDLFKRMEETKLERNREF